MVSEELRRDREATLALLRHLAGEAAREGYDEASTSFRGAVLALRRSWGEKIGPADTLDERARVWNGSGGHADR